MLYSLSVTCTYLPALQMLVPTAGPSIVPLSS
jgi:hypothetical protein